MDILISAHPWYRVSQECIDVWKPVAPKRFIRLLSTDNSCVANISTWIRKSSLSKSGLSFSNYEWSYKDASSRSLSKKGLRSLNKDASNSALHLS